MTLFFDAFTRFGRRPNQHRAHPWTLDHLLAELKHCSISGALVADQLCVLYDAMHQNLALLEKLKPDPHKRSVKLHAIVYGPAGMNVDEDESARTLRRAAQITGGTFQAAGPDDLASAYQKVGRTGLAGR